MVVEGIGTGFWSSSSELKLEEWVEEQAVAAAAADCEEKLEIERIRRDITALSAIFSLWSGLKIFSPDEN